MKWVGKIGGGLLGLVTFGPVGALAGAILGHQFDRGLETAEKPGSKGGGWRGVGGRSHTGRQQVFFETTFLVMGHLAKADGRVSEEEIRVARAVMHQMRLRPEHVQLAISLFTRGKRPEFALNRQVETFRDACGRHRDLIRNFLEVQFELTLSKGSIKSAERDLLWQIAAILGVGRAELAQLEAIVRARHAFRQGRRPGRTQSDSLGQAYKALGIPKTATNREVKTAYRRLMNQHHPDKLVARGLPDSMQEAAKERTREIRSAYEMIKEDRNMK